jgi:hypothetical protein
MAVDDLGSTDFWKAICRNMKLNSGFSTECMRSTFRCGDISTMCHFNGFSTTLPTLARKYEEMNTGSPP